MVNSTEILTVDSPEIARFLKAWHENRRAGFERSYKNLVYDTYAPKHANNRRKFIALDCGSGGVFLVERSTTEVFRIKAYGTPNRKKNLGPLANLTTLFECATAEERELGYATY